LQTPPNLRAPRWSREKGVKWGGAARLYAPVVLLGKQSVGIAAVCKVAGRDG